MINYQEAEKVIKEYFKGHARVSDVADDCKNVLDLLKKLDKDGWIPCSSGEMPENGQEVMVWFEYFRYGQYNRLYQTIGISWAWKGEWSGMVDGQSGWRDLRIIAWQPLPEAYKEG